MFDSSSISDKLCSSARKSRSDPACSMCGLASICLPLVLQKEDLVQLDGVIQRCRPLQKGMHLYSAGESFNSVFVVRTGCVKTYVLTEQGEEQVTGFYFPGEVLGLDGVGSNQYSNYARALESSATCEIPFHLFEAQAARIPGLQHHFFKLMSREIQQDQQLMLLLSKATAEARIAAFLVNITSRFALRKLSSDRIYLPMSRNDIGNYLGLAVETVSRIFTRLQNQGVLAVEGKNVKILNAEQLNLRLSSQAQV